MPPFRGQRKPCLEDVWDLLEDSGQTATVAYGKALRAAHDAPSVAVRWALELVDEISANQDTDMVRARLLREKRLHRKSLLELKDVPVRELHELAQLGRYADDLLTEHYDELSEEEVTALVAKLEENEPVEMKTHPLGVLMGYTVTFTGEEIKKLKRLANGNDIHSHIKERALQEE